MDRVSVHGVIKSQMQLITQTRGEPCSLNCLLGT